MLKCTRVGRWNWKRPSPVDRHGPQLRHRATQPSSEFFDSKLFLSKGDAGTKTIEKRLKEKGHSLTGPTLDLSHVQAPGRIVVKCPFGKLSTRCREMRQVEEEVAGKESQFSAEMSKPRRRPCKDLWR